MVSRAIDCRVAEFGTMLDRRPGWRHKAFHNLQVGVSGHVQVAQVLFRHACLVVYSTSFFAVQKQISYPNPAFVDHD